MNNSSFSQQSAHSTHHLFSKNQSSFKSNKILYIHKLEPNLVVMDEPIDSYRPETHRDLIIHDFKRGKKKKILLGLDLMQRRPCYSGPPLKMAMIGRESFAGVPSVKHFQRMQNLPVLRSQIGRGYCFNSRPCLFIGGGGGGHLVDVDLVSIQIVIMRRRFTPSCSVSAL